MDTLHTLDNGTTYNLVQSFRIRKGERETIFEVVVLDANGNTVAMWTKDTEDDARFAVALVKRDGCDGCGNTRTDLYASPDGDASYCGECDALYAETDSLVRDAQDRDGIAWTTIFPTAVANPVVGRHPLQGSGSGRLYRDGSVDATDGDFYSVSPGFESVADFDSWYLAEYAETEAKDDATDERIEAISYALRKIRDLADGIPALREHDPEAVADDCGTIHNLASLALLSLANVAKGGE